MSALDLMIDLETMGTSPGCAIASIGAVRFDRDADGWPADAAHEFYVRVDLADCQRHGLTLSADTLEWWMERADRWPSPMGRLPLKMSLGRLGAFVRGDLFILNMSGTFHDPLSVAMPWGDRAGRIWSHGASFDVPILDAAYRALGLSDPPWNWRVVRDTRTLFDLAGIEHKTQAHHALEDARAQALAVQAAMRKLRGEQS